MQNLKKNWSVISKMTRVWWILTRAIESLKNVHFYWFLLCKVFKVWSKKVQRSYFSWHWKLMQNLKKNWFVVSNMTRIWWILTWTLESFKKSYFNGLLLNYILFQLKKYRGVIFHDTEEWCKIWRKTALLLGKWHEEFCKFSSEHLKVSKLELW